MAGSGQLYMPDAAGMPRRVIIVSYAVKLYALLDDDCIPAQIGFKNVKQTCLQYWHNVSHAASMLQARKML